MAQTLATISFSPRNQAQRYRKRPPFSSQECKSYPEDGARPKLHSLQLCSYPSVLNSIYLQAYTLTKTWFCNVGTGKKDADHKNNLKHLHILKEYSRIRFGNNPREAKTNDTVGLLLASLFFFFPTSLGQGLSLHARAGHRTHQQVRTGGFVGPCSFGLI